jgi:hypothetical protein
MKAERPPLSAKQRNALEIGFCLRTVAMAIAQLRHMSYNPIAGKAGTLAELAEVSLLLDKVETKLRAYNVEMVKQNKRLLIAKLQTEL